MAKSIRNLIIQNFIQDNPCKNGKLYNVQVGNYFPNILQQID